MPLHHNLLVASVILLAPCFPRVSALLAADLEVATFNCEWLIRDRIEMKFGTSDLTDEQREQMFSEAVGVAAQVIRRIDADVIGLVEVGGEADVEQLRLAVQDADGAPIYPHKEVCISTDPTKQHVAVLSKLPLSSVVKQIPGREFYDAELDDPEDENSTGISKGLKVTFESAGRPIHLYVCHLISERAGFETDQQRVAQASIIRRHYLQFLNNDEHVIVAGDLNAGRGSPAVRRIRGRDDLFGDLIQTGLADFFEADQLDERWTYEFRGHRNQIDHVLPSWSLKEATTKISARTLDVEEMLSNGQKVSDHRPFIVTLKFRQ